MPTSVTIRRRSRPPRKPPSNSAIAQPDQPDHHLLSCSPSRACESESGYPCYPFRLELIDLELHLMLQDEPHSATPIDAVNFQRKIASFM